MALENFINYERILQRLEVERRMNKNFLQSLKQPKTLKNNKNGWLDLYK